MDLARRDLQVQPVQRARGAEGLDQAGDGDRGHGSQLHEFVKLLNVVKSRAMTEGVGALRRALCGRADRWRDAADACAGVRGAARVRHRPADRGRARRGAAGQPGRRVGRRALPDPDQPRRAASARPARARTSSASATTPGTRRSIGREPLIDALGTRALGGCRRARRGLPGRARGCRTRAEFFAFLKQELPGDVGALPRQRFSSALSSGTLAASSQRSREGRMTELQQYLAEEVAEDHADGIITRREAMRRLGLLGVGAAAATAMLAAEARRAATRRRPRPRRHGHGHDHGDGGRVDGVGAGRDAGRSRSPGPHGHADGRLGAGGQAAQGGVLVIHENRGLTDHIRNVAGRFARQRLVGARARPALRGGRHGRVPGRGRGRWRRCRRSRRQPAALRRRHEGGGHRARQARRRASRSRRSASASAAA